MLFIELDYCSELSIPAHGIEHFKFGRRELIGVKVGNDRFIRILRDFEAGNAEVYLIEQRSAAARKELEIGGAGNKAVMVTVFEQSQHEMDRDVKFFLVRQIKVVDNPPYILHPDQVFPALALNMDHAVIAFKTSVGNKNDRPLKA